MRINETKIDIIKQDITEQNANAIVNAADSELSLSGGIASSIRRKGGPTIEEEAKKIAPVNLAEAILTKAGNLKAKYIIHAVTCQKGSKTNQDILRKATRNCLAKTKDKDIETVALPALGCGAAGFAYEKAAKIMIEEVLSFCQNNNNLKEIIFVLNDKKSYRIFKDVIRERFDKVKKKIQQHPIPTVDIIIEKEGKVILIERKNPPFGWAIPGGFVELDESVETSAQREAEEETGIKVKNLKQFRVYSEPGRDPRFHTISCVFTAQSDSEPKASTDAKKAEFFTKFNLPDNIVFDHRKILKDYFDSRNKE